MMITVKDFGSNIEIFGSDYNFGVSGDDCLEASYEENLDDVLERISDAEGRDLTDEEKEMVEDKIRTWLDAHSLDDNQESTDNDSVILEWQEAGGVLGYDTDRNGKTSLYIMDDGEFYDRCKEFTEDKDAVAKLLCESALRNAGISEEKIDQLMNWE